MTQKNANLSTADNGGYIVKTSKYDILPQGQPGGLDCDESKTLIFLSIEDAVAAISEFFKKD